jgi:hypothetical protein
MIANLPAVSASWEGSAIKVRMANTTATANVATVRPASDQASQVAVRRLIRVTSCPILHRSGA